LGLLRPIGAVWFALDGEALEAHFDVGAPLYGPYLYRWDLGESLRHDEEDAIARAEIPAVGARLVAQRVRHDSRSRRGEAAPLD
jgi:hypothetical protein